MVKQWTCVLVAVVSLKATLSLASTIVRAVPYKVIPGKCRVAHDRPLAPIGVRTTETCGGSCSLLDCRKKCRESATCVAFEYFTKDDSTPTRCELLDEFPSYVESEHYTECYMLRSDVCPLAESDSIMIYAATVKVNGMMNIIEDNGDIYNLGFTDLDHATIRKKVDKICRQNTPVEHHCNLPYFSPRALVSISASDQLVDWGDYDIDGFSYLGEVYAGYEIPENFMNDGFYSLLSNEETEDGLGTKTLSELGIISNAEKFWTGTNNDGTAGAACEGPGGEAWSSVSAGDLGIFGSADTTTSDWQNGGGELSCAETEATILCACTCNQKLQMTMAPTASPTSPTSSPTVSPTSSPTTSPTSSPTASPTSSPTTSPTSSPTTSPTSSPTTSPTSSPTTSPTSSPTTSPTSSPTTSPTSSPTTSPTSSPTTSPTSSPTTSPTSSPTNSPEMLLEDIKDPTASPTNSPTTSPTSSPTTSPTSSPTTSPTSSPTTSPTSSPTASPTSSPTTSPTSSPTASPTTSPTTSPTSSPTNSPEMPVEDIKDPTASPTTSPTISPTTAPTTSPTNSPTDSPEMVLSESKVPTSSPTISPTASPNAPTESPTNAPTQSPVFKCVTENFVHDQPSSDPRVVANDLMVPGPGVACSAFGERYVVSGFTESSTRNYAQYYVYDGSHSLLYAGSRSLRYKQDLVAAEISDDGLVLVAGFPGYTYRSKQCGMFEVYILNTKTYSFAKSSTEYTDRTAAGEIGRVLNIDSFTDDEVSPRTTNERRFHWPTIATSSLPLREVYIFITTSGKSSGWRECHDCEPITVADPGYDDGFGSSLAVRQHFLLIGAPKTSSGSQLEAGRVYIQKRPGGHAYWDTATSIPSGLENTYNQFAPYMPVSVPQILPYVDNPSCATEPSCAGDRFGEAVAMTRDQSCFIVGAPGAGKAFVFCERYQEVAPFAKFYALVKTFETSNTSETFASKVGIESFEVDGVRQWIATIHDPDNLSAPILVSHSFGHKVFHNLKRVEPTTLSGTSLSGYCHRAGLSAFASNNGITRYARSSTEAGCI